MADAVENAERRNNDAAASLYSPTPAHPAITSIAGPAAPTTSAAAAAAADNSTVKKPRDARVIHMILAVMGITAYEERVPLQLLDFAYRYTASVLQDALYLSAEGHAGAGPRHAGGAKDDAGGAGGANKDSTSLSLTALRLSIASRLHYQSSMSLPKEFLLDLASERNRVALPPVRQEWGIRLPPEKYCLTGVGWGLKDDWDSDEDIEIGDADDEEDEAAQGFATENGHNEDTKDENEDDNDEDDDDDDAAMEDIFGEDPGGQDGEGEAEAGTAEEDGADRRMSGT
ncbi:MAG: Transcription initiation factor TFIID subunit 9 [Lichina confinis]|nr:MAG: Transcription initiation factor TFIID subunit 9 [Lichina confinis]